MRHQISHFGIFTLKDCKICALKGLEELKPELLKQLWTVDLKLARIIDLGSSITKRPEVLKVPK